MKIVLASEYGFCHGVKLALHKLDEAIESNPDKKIYSIGEIIHNKDVIHCYEEKGVQTVESIFDIKGGVGIVRAHGLPTSVIDEAKVNSLRVIDATCPYVRHISSIIAQEIKNKSSIFLIGEPNHPEVYAATHDFKEHVTVIDHKHFDPERFQYPSGKIAILSQTTMSESAFQEIVASFVQKNSMVTVYNTICPSTKNRQSAARETAEKVDFMVILGGKESSNTRRLFEICNKIVPSYHIERIAELDLGKIQGFKTAGITAGASTPDWIVQEAVELLEKI